MHFPTRFVILAVTLLATACGTSLTLPDSADAGRVVGILEWTQAPTGGGLGEPPPGPGVTAPDTVRAGEPFRATVTTVGPSICWTAAGASLELEPAVAVVTPYDHTPEDERTGCGDAVVALPRSVELRFTRAGEAILRVHGRKVVGREMRSAEHPMVLEKRIVVR